MLACKIELLFDKVFIEGAILLVYVHFDVQDVTADQMLPSKMGVL